MSITFGRVGLSQSGVTLPDPERWDRSGSVVTLAGVAKASTVADAVHLSQQLNGLASNPDEPFIACTWDQEPGFDGFYRVLGVDVGSVPVSLAAGWFPYRIELERVPTVNGYVGVESALVGATMSNGAGVTTSRHWHAVPVAAIDYWPGEPSTHTSLAKDCETGNLEIAYWTAAAAGPWDLNARYSVTAGDFYDGACRIEVDMGSSVYRTVVGRDAYSPGAALRLNNGVIRAYNTMTAFDAWNGSAWETVVSGAFVPYSDGSSLSTALQATGFWQILRNSPEEVAVRYTYSIANSIDVVTVDYVLRRGAPFVVGYIQCTRTVYTWAFDNPTGGSSAIGTNSYTRGSDDANGNRWFSTWSKAATVNSGTGGHYLNASTDSAAFVLGVYRDYATATGPNSAAVIQQMIWAAETERMTVVRR